MKALRTLTFGILFLSYGAFLVGCSTMSAEQGEAGDSPVAETLDEAERDAQPEGLSDLTAIGGNLHVLEIVLDEDGAVASCKTVRSIQLEGRTDLEGCAFDPLDGCVWVADEHDTSIRQFDPATGKEIAAVLVPEVFRRNVVHFLSVDKELSFRNVFQTGDHAKSCGLSASRRSYEYAEFLVFDCDV